MASVTPVWTTVARLDAAQPPEGIGVGGHAAGERDGRQPVPVERPVAVPGQVQPNDGPGRVEGRTGRVPELGVVRPTEPGFR